MNWMTGSINFYTLQPDGVGRLDFPTSSEKDFYEGEW